MKFNLYIYITVLLSFHHVNAQTLPQIKSFKHSSACFTQGLIIQNNVVWESCGGYGKSQLKNWDLQTGKVINRTTFDKKHFAEGLTSLNNKLYMLTWKAGVAYEIDQLTLKTIKKHIYHGEGWGLTNDDELLIMSNGSSKIQFINPESFAVVKTIQVQLNNTPIQYLNELEYIDGLIWANVFTTDYIVVIDPDSGQVVNRHYFPDLIDKQQKTGVLNGIAYDKTTKKMWITGKNWPYIFNL